MRNARILLITAATLFICDEVKSCQMSNADRATLDSASCAIQLSPRGGFGYAFSKFTNVPAILLNMLR